MEVIVLVFWLILRNSVVVVVIMPNHLTPPNSLGDEYKRRLTPKPRFCERMKVIDIIFGSLLLSSSCQLVLFVLALVSSLRQLIVVVVVVVVYVVAYSITMRG
jgi:hypothetical protein